MTDNEQPDRKDSGDGDEHEFTTAELRGDELPDDGMGHDEINAYHVAKTRFEHDLEGDGDD